MFTSLYFSTTPVFQSIILWCLGNAGGFEIFSGRIGTPFRGVDLIKRWSVPLSPRLFVMHSGMTRCQNQHAQLPRHIAQLLPKVAWEIWFRPLDDPGSARVVGKSHTWGHRYVPGTTSFQHPAGSCFLGDFHFIAARNLIKGLCQWTRFWFEISYGTIISFSWTILNQSRDVSDVIVKCQKNFAEPNPPPGTIKVNLGSVSTSCNPPLGCCSSSQVN